jgi:hypothetical protein
VLRIKTKGHREETTVVGSLPSVTAGEWLVATQHYMLLQRNLIYTGITRGKKLVVLIGQKKALGIAVRNDRPQRRYSGLFASLRGEGQPAAVS